MVARRAGFSLGDAADHYGGCAFTGVVDSRRLGDEDSIIQIGSRVAPFGEDPVLVVGLCEGYESVLTVSSSS